MEGVVIISGHDPERERRELLAVIRGLETEVYELRKNLNLDKWIEKYQKEAEEQNASLTSDNAALRRRVDQLTHEAENLRKQLEVTKAKLKAEKEAAKAKQDADKETIKTLKAGLKKASKECDQLSKENESLRNQVTLSEEALKKAEEKSKEDERKIKKLEKEKLSLGGKVEELKAKSRNQANHTNSSRTTAQVPNHKPIVVNSREKTDNPQGAQCGHPHHGRHIGTPSGGDLIICGEDSPLWDDPDYAFDEYVTKVVPLIVTQMHAVTYYVPRFKNRKTGAYINAKCPDGLKDDINPSPETKALIIYLTYLTNLGVTKCRNLLKDMTQGQYAPCEGFINELPLELAKKSSAEQAGVYAEMLGVHAMHVDGTSIRVGGRQYNVTICVAGNRVLYFFRPRKGYSGVTDTPIEKTCAILIHDHAIEFYAYGSGHQECLEHIKRYLKRSIEQEPNLTWNIKMYEFIIKLMADAKKADEERKAAKNDDDDEEVFIASGNPHARFTDAIIEEYTTEFHKILDLGIQEYEKFPAKDWFRDGKNLCTRLKEHPENYLLFLSDDQVDYDNNDAERAARQIKRKQACCMEFRGFLSVVAYCESKSIIEILKATNLPVLDALAEIFRREATTENEITLQKEHLMVLKSALETETEIKKRDEKKLTDTEEEKKIKTEELDTARKKLEQAKAKRIAKPGKESSPDEAEAGLVDRCHHLEHIIYLLDLEIKRIKKDIAFDEIRSKDIENKIAKTEDTLKRLERKKEKEQQEVKEERIPAELPKADLAILAAAIEERDAARAKLNEAFKKQLASYSVYAKEACTPVYGKEAVRDVCGNVLIGDIMKKHTERAETAAKAVEEAKKETEQALALFSAAEKKLDAVKKGYRIRNRKPGKNQEEGGEVV